ncbi:TetR family transcriptional regulator [Streptomyces camponoticapitis]|uniref:TetR family transcriptional regulator n=1 Tax=Streptomyces camponoticapitis TaxID=1616125 RepID=A0ABQ2E5G7_9ACTN|nr:TetR/AcrR family transcriptional regulator [Streptomyces camponoticapitis]GGJ94397.1 TetR family transcriptional regulator [Streptomyces camponoticapitis]
MKPARARILDAAAELMGTIGLARATTKEIARAAGCSEAALYKYFSGKEELFLRVLEERLPRLGPLLSELGEGPFGANARNSVEENLTEVVRQAALFYEATFPIGASLFAEPALLRRHAEGMRALGAGPRWPLRALAGYLRAEREAGRVRAGADADAVASLLLGACLQRAFLKAFPDGEQVSPLDEFVPALVRTVLPALSP